MSKLVETKTATQPVTEEMLDFATKDLSASGEP